MIGDRYQDEDKSLEEYVIDISAYWQTIDGKPRTVNSVYEEFLGTENQLTPKILKAALEGRHDRGKISNLIKLARLCSIWAGHPVTIDQIIKKSIKNPGASRVLQG